ncbi:hypothetical protein C4E22_05575 [ANME-1 cluster archaeon AG-394-G06]|nr:hypothetical protein [ANME-1 cluster archaeon AG-394-G06]
MLKRLITHKLVFDTSALICDDYESFWYLSENFEKTGFSVFVVRCLCEKGIISMEEGWSFIEMIRERRTWGDNIIYRTAKTLWDVKNVGGGK